MIIPTFRREKLLVEAVTSALSQRDVDVEVIVVDDDAERGSARDIVSAAFAGEGRVTYARRVTPSGGRPALARNEGMRLAKGDVIHFLDDDDQLCDGALAALRERIERRDVGVAYGTVVPFGDDASIVATEQAYYDDATRVARRSPRRLDVAREILFGKAPLIGPACMIKKDVALSLGGFDASLAVCEDYHLFVRAIRRHGAAFVDQPVLRHRTGLPSISRDVTQAQTLAAYAEIYRAYRRDFGTPEFYALKLAARARRFVSVSTT